MKSLILSLFIVLPAAAAPPNLLRNGSFEGGTLYWHQIDPQQHALVKDAAAGEYALRIAKGNARRIFARGGILGLRQPAAALSRTACCPD
jgi:hypothetical protein